MLNIFNICYPFCFSCARPISTPSAARRRAQTSPRSRSSRPRSKSSSAPTAFRTILPFQARRRRMRRLMSVSTAANARPSARSATGFSPSPPPNGRRCAAYSWARYSPRSSRAAISRKAPCRPPSPPCWPR